MQIDIPIHPDDQSLPKSVVQLKMPSGKVFSFVGLPIQGQKTLQNALDILEIWRPTIVVPDPPERSITEYNPGFAAWQLGTLIRLREIVYKFHSDNCVCEDCNLVRKKKAFPGEEYKKVK